MLYNVVISLRSNQYRSQPRAFDCCIKLRFGFSYNTFHSMTCKQRNKVGVVGRAKKLFETIPI